MHALSLKPFAEVSSTQKFAIATTLTRQANILHLDYQLLGDLSAILLPEPVPSPDRRDQLWQSTCFEFFLALSQSPTYWEFNLAPDHRWNVYRFDDYRQGMQPEQAITHLPLTTDCTPKGYRLSLCLDLDPLIDASFLLNVGITAVIAHLHPKTTLPNSTKAFGEHRDCAQPPQDLSYWALTHLGPGADFHRRDSFILEI